MGVHFALHSSSECQKRNNPAVINIATKASHVFAMLTTGTCHRPEIYTETKTDNHSLGLHCYSNLNCLLTKMYTPLEVG